MEDIEEMSSVQECGLAVLSVHIAFLMGRQRIGDNIQIGCVIELYQLVINEVLDTVSQLETFL